jgi:inner membrane protein involved in colicin E2 resistance
MTGLEALAAWWGYADGDPRLVGAIVVLVALAAVVFLARRIASRANRPDRR